MAVLKPGGWLVACESAFRYRPETVPHRVQQLWHHWHHWLDAVLAAGGSRIDFALVQAAMPYGIAGGQRRPR